MTDAASEELIVSERSGRVLIATLNRPHVRNAMNLPMVEVIIATLQAADADHGIGAIVLTGADPVFCAGADLKEIAAHGTAEDIFTRVDRSRDMYSMIARMRTPVIAAVNGHAVAGGCGLAMACDLVVAADGAEFGYPEVQKGLVAALVMVSLSRLAGKRLGMELLLTGKRISAREALDAGMVNAVTSKEELMPTALALAGSIAARDPVIVAITKDLFHRVSEMPVDDAMDRARIANLLVRELRSSGSAGGERE